MAKEQHLNITFDDETLLKQLKFPEKTIESIISLKTKPQRNDIIECILRNSMNILWLFGNIDDHQSSIPRDIVNSGDPTKTIPSDVLILAKKTIESLRPKYIVSTNKILHNWMNNILETHKTTVSDVHKNLLKIRDLNTEKRLNHSIKKVEPASFDELVKRTIMNRL